MGRESIESGVYIGVVTARSVEEPSPAEDIYYTVVVEDGISVYPLIDIVPQRVARWSSYFEVDLVPFTIGQLVQVGVSRYGGTDRFEIMSEEKPYAGDCTR